MRYEVPVAPNGTAIGTNMHCGSEHIHVYSYGPGTPRCYPLQKREESSEEGSARKTVFLADPARRHKSIFSCLVVFTSFLGLTPILRGAHHDTYP